MHLSSRKSPIIPPISHRQRYLFSAPAILHSTMSSAQHFRSTQSKVRLTRRLMRSPRTRLHIILWYRQTDKRPPTAHQILHPTCPRSLHPIRLMQNPSSPSTLSPIFARQYVRHRSIPISGGTQRVFYSDASHEYHLLSARTNWGGGL